jgi:hypothetical protein
LQGKYGVLPLLTFQFGIEFGKMDRRLRIQAAEPKKQTLPILALMMDDCFALCTDHDTNAADRLLALPTATSMPAGTPPEPRCVWRWLCRVQQQLEALAEQRAGGGQDLEG